MTKLAYAIAEIPHVAPIGRSKLFEEIAAGRLRVRRVGRRTIVLAKDLEEYLSLLPTSLDAVTPSEAAEDEL